MGFRAKREYHRVVPEMQSISQYPTWTFGVLALFKLQDLLEGLGTKGLEQQSLKTKLKTR